MIKGIAFVVYAVTDMPRAKKFYEGVLGLKTNGDFPGSENWVEYAVGSDTLTLGCSPEWKPSSDGAVVALEVDNVVQMAEELKSKGVSFKLEPQNFPSCNMAVIYDPDKNLIMIHQKK